MTHIIFVCHGNICRSPMAEFIMKDLVRKAGLEEEISVTSLAATSEDVGRDMYPAARAKLAEKGIPFTKRAARKITPEDYRAADYVIAMDDENLRDLSRITGGDPDKKISLLLSWAGQTRSVADPWYSGDFETAYKDICMGCEGLLAKIAK